MHMNADSVTGTVEVIISARFYLIADQCIYFTPRPFRIDRMDENLNRGFDGRSVDIRLPRLRLILLQKPMQSRTDASWRMSAIFPPPALLSQIRA